MDYVAEHNPGKFKDRLGYLTVPPPRSNIITRAGARAGGLVWGGL